MKNSHTRVLQCQRAKMKGKRKCKKRPTYPLCREVCRSCVSKYVLFDFLYYSIFWGLRQADCEQNIHFCELFVQGVVFFRR